jgi:hypothetical protein
VGRYQVPARFDATAVRRDVGDFPTVEMEIEIEGGQPVITALTLRSDSSLIRDRDGRAWSLTESAQRSKRAITASLLRELPLARLAKYAMLGVAVRLGERGAEDVVPWELVDHDGFYEIGPDAFRDPEAYYRDDPDLPTTDYGPWSEPWIEPWTQEMQELSRQVEGLRAPRRRNRINDELLSRVAEVYREAIEERRPPKKAVQEALYVSKPTAGRYIMKARARRGFLGSTVPGKKGEISP